MQLRPHDRSSLWLCLLTASRKQALGTQAALPCWGLDEQSSKRGFPNRTGTPLQSLTCRASGSECLCAFVQYLRDRKAPHKKGRRPWGTSPPDLFLSSAKSCSSKRRLWLGTNGISGCIVGCSVWVCHGLLCSALLCLSTSLGYQVFPPSCSPLLQSSSPERPPLPPSTSGTLAFILGPSPEVLTTTRRHRDNPWMLDHIQALPVF